jgi:hypothetical protein
MGWGALAGAAIGAVGNVLGSKGGGEKWSPYGPAKGAINGYIDQLSGTPIAQAYGGPVFADMNPYLSNSLGAMNQFAGSQGMGGQYASNMMNMGMGALGRGLTGFEGQLQGMQNRGPNQFRFDQGLYNQAMNNYMPGIRSAVDAQGKISSMGLQSNLGQLVSDAGANTGAFGSNPLSKLGQGSAALQAQNTLNNQQFAAGLYNTANAGAMGAGMQAGAANLNSANALDSNVLSGYGRLAGMGQSMAGAGYGAGLQNLGLGLKSGQIQQAYDQSKIDALMKNHYLGQSVASADIMNRIGSLGGLGGQTSVQSNPWQSAWAGAQGGLALWDAFKNGDG